MTIGAVALGTSFGDMQVGGDAHADCPAVNAIFQLVRSDLLFLL